MKILIILVSLLATVFALPGKEVRSRNQVVPAGRPEGRITRGSDAYQGQLPYQVGLVVERRRTFSDCGGSLLNNEWVLTAAHCTLGALKAQVLLGAVDFRFPQHKYEVSRQNIIIHADYKKRTLENDISLIKIPFTHYSRNVQPVKLPAMGRSYSDYSGEGVIASGWGNISDKRSDTPDKLQWVHLNIISNRVCAKIFKINPTNICTDTVAGANICDGDSGGPIVLEYSGIQIGITSFGDEKCLKNVPSVFTRITSYLGWIQSHTGITN